MMQGRRQSLGWVLFMAFVLFVPAAEPRKSKSMLRDGSTAAPPPPDAPPRGRGSGQGGLRSKKQKRRRGRKKSSGLARGRDAADGPQQPSEHTNSGTGSGTAGAGAGPSAGLWQSGLTSSDGLPQLVDSVTGRGAGASSFIKATPPSVGFGSKSLYVPAVAKVKIHFDAKAKGAPDSFELKSIGSDLVQMHAVKFKRQILRRGDTATVRVIYLPRTLGPSKGHLVIHTSAGDFKYPVQGQGAPNQYGLSAFVAPRIPVGALYNPPIKLRNPRSTKLHVKEVYTSEAFLHLTLPPEANAGSDPFDDAASDANTRGGNAAVATSTSAGMWVVEPRSEREVIKLSFQSHTPGQFNGYVHVKTDHENMVLPVELTVLRSGLHADPQRIDFGVVSAARPSTSATVAIINSGSSAVKMLKAEAEAIKGDSEHLRVDFLHPTIQPGKEVPNALRVSFVPRVGSETKLEGKIIVHTNDTNPINTMFEIWYVARILSGRIRYNPERTHFVVEPPSAECAWLSKPKSSSLALQSLQRATRAAPKEYSRVIDLQNRFGVPVTMLSARINDLEDSHEGLFTVRKFPDGETALPGASWKPIEVIFRPMHNTSAIGAAQLVLDSNLSAFHIPLTFSHGRLAVSMDRFGARGRFALSAPRNASVETAKVDAVDGWSLELPHASDAAQRKGALCWEIPSNARASKEGFGLLDFGSIASGEQRTLRINLTNTNPLPIVIKSIAMENLATGKPQTGGREVFFDVLSVTPANNMPKSVRSFRGSWKWEATEKIKNMRAQYPSRSALIVPPGHVAVLAVTIVAVASGSSTRELTLKVHTTLETLSFALSYRTENGSLRPSPSMLRFEPSFPGKSVSQSLALHSTFSRPVHLLSLKAAHPFVQPIAMSALLRPERLNQVGVVLHNATFGCQDYFERSARLQAREDVASSPVWQCLRHRFGISDSGWNKRLSLFGFPLRPSDIDVLQRREKEWAAIKRAGRASVVTSVTIETDVANVVVPVQAKVMWPTLFVTKNGRMELPLTQVGEVTSTTIVVRNPSDRPIKVQLLALAGTGVATGSQPPQSWDTAPDLSQSTEDSQGNGGGPFYLHRGDGSSEPRLLAPGEKIFLGPLEFRPVGMAQVSCKVYLRNNLTGIESLAVIATGGSGLLRLRPIKGAVLRTAKSLSVPTTSDAVNSTLAFEVNATHLKRQNGVRVATLSNTIKVRAENRGSLPLVVHSLDIGGTGCRGLGFKVHGCSKTPFEIRPNTARTVRISFQPDCSTALVRTTLNLETSLGLSRYGLEASILPEVLPLCDTQLGKLGQARMSVRLSRYAAILVSLLVFACFVCKDIATQISHLSDRWVSFKILSNEMMSRNGAVAQTQKEPIASQTLSSASGEDESTALSEQFQAQKLAQEEERRSQEATKKKEREEQRQAQLEVKRQKEKEREEKRKQAERSRQQQAERIEEQRRAEERKAEAEERRIAAERIEERKKRQQRERELREQREQQERVQKEKAERERRKKLEVEKRAKRAKEEADAKVRREAKEKAKRLEQEQARQKAKREAEEKAKRAAADKAKRELELKARRKAEAEKAKAEEKARAARAKKAAQQQQKQPVPARGVKEVMGGVDPLDSLEFMLTQRGGKILSGPKSSQQQRESQRGQKKTQPQSKSQQKLPPQQKLLQQQQQQLLQQQRLLENQRKQRQKQKQSQSQSQSQSQLGSSALNGDIFDVAGAHARDQWSSSIGAPSTAEFQPAGLASSRGTSGLFAASLAAGGSGGGTSTPSNTDGWGSSGAGVGGASATGLAGASTSTSSLFGGDIFSGGSGIFSAAGPIDGGGDRPQRSTSRFMSFMGGNDAADSGGGSADAAGAGVSHADAGLFGASGLFETSTGGDARLEALDARLEGGIEDGDDMPPAFFGAGGFFGESKDGEAIE